jgi:histidinol-phosphate aminotransferase
VAARLNVNENPFPLPSDLVDAITASVRGVVSGLNRYPDRDATALRQALADYVGTQSSAHLGVDQIWAANGSNEVMHHLFLAFGGPGRSALTFTPTYSMYPEYARDTFTGFTAIPRNAAFGVDLETALPAIRELRPSLVLLSSPNNPSGTALPQEDLRAIAEVALEQGAMVIVDEAYSEFRRHGTASALELLGRYPNVVVTRTMSKAFGLAGARLGYAVAADPSVIDVLSVVRLPYHLSAVTQAVALAALEHSAALLSQVAILRDERDQLLGWLVDHGFVVAQSDANFIMFSGFDDRDKVWRELLDQGVLIRVPEPAGWLRVSIGTPDENDLFRRALLVATQGKSATEQHTANQEGTP